MKVNIWEFCVVTLESREKARTERARTGKNGQERARTEQACKGRSESAVVYSRQLERHLVHQVEHVVVLQITCSPYATHTRVSFHHTTQKFIKVAMNNTRDVKVRRRLRRTRGLTRRNIRNVVGKR